MAKTSRIPRQIRRSPQARRRTCSQPSQERLGIRNATIHHLVPAPPIIILEPVLARSTTLDLTRFRNGHLIPSPVDLMCLFPRTTLPKDLTNPADMSVVMVKSPETHALGILVSPGNLAMLEISVSLENLVNPGISAILEILILLVPIVHATSLSDERKITAGNHLELTDQVVVANMSETELEILRAVEVTIMVA